MVGEYRKLSEPQKKVVAARQLWKCSTCQIILPSTYQVDHTVPLWEGGEDTIENCTAMCPGCHAQKTQQEAIRRSQQRARSSVSFSERYDNRTDFFNNGIATCELCMQQRPMGTVHHRCPAIDMECGEKTIAALDRFRFIPRNNTAAAQEAWSAMFGSPSNHL